MTLESTHGAAWRFCGAARIGARNDGHSQRQQLTGRAALVRSCWPVLVPHWLLRAMPAMHREVLALIAQVCQAVQARFAGYRRYYSASK